MKRQQIIFEDLGIIRYKAAWEYQEEKVTGNLEIKSAQRKLLEINLDNNLHSPQDELYSKKNQNPTTELDYVPLENGTTLPSTTHYLLFCEHPPVYTLGKSGHIENVLLTMSELEKKNIEFFRTNRGGDITFHGLQQVVGYPILDLEKFSTDLGKYLRNLEEVIIRAIAEYGLIGNRSEGETGVWLDPGIPGKERKICALGIRCSRWITMHGFALNANTDLSYFQNIIPCGIVNKQVTSMEKELGYQVNLPDLKEKLLFHFGVVFNADLHKSHSATPAI